MADEDSSLFANEFDADVTTPIVRKSDQFWIFAGGLAAYNGVDSDLLSEVDKTGGYYEATAQGSLMTGGWGVLDVGGGWSYNRISGPSITDKSKDVRITTQSGFAHVSPRFQFAENFQIGPAAQLAFGTDLSLSEAKQTNSALWLGGLRLVFQTPIANWSDLRINVQLLTDINATDRQSFIAGAGLQIGLPVADL